MIYCQYGFGCTQLVLSVLIDKLEKCICVVTVTLRLHIACNWGVKSHEIKLANNKNLQHKKINDYDIFDIF